MLPLRFILQKHPCDLLGRALLSWLLRNSFFQDFELFHLGLSLEAFPGDDISHPIAARDGAVLLWRTEH